MQARAAPCLRTRYTSEREQSLARRVLPDSNRSAGVALHPALVDGFTLAFLAGVGIVAFGIGAALTLIRRAELEPASAEAEPPLELAV